MRFAALHGVKYPSFANWVQGRRRRRAAEPQPVTGSLGGGAGVVQWLEAEVGEWKGGEGSGGLIPHLPCRVRNLRRGHNGLLALGSCAAAIDPVQSFKIPPLQGRAASRFGAPTGKLNGPT